MTADDQPVQRSFFKRFQPDSAVIAGALLLLIAVSTWACFRPGYYIVQYVFACQLSGYGALSLLAISILFGPLLRAAGWLGLQVGGKFSARISKNTGIASAVAAWAHAVLSLVGYLNTNWMLIFEHSYLSAGFVALIVFTLLLLASIKPLMSRFGWRLWKPTFRLSLAAAILAFYHIFYAPSASMHWTLGLFGAALVLFLLRFLPNRRRRAICEQPERQPTP